MLNKKLFLKSALIITLATLLSKVLGLIRQQYSIYLFGGGWEFDSFIAAFRIPNALRELLAEGAFSAAFIPLFAAILVRGGKKEAFLFANKVLNLAIILTLAVAVAGTVISSSFMLLYHSNPQFSQASILASQLFNIMMFFLPFISLSALIMGMLNSMDQFTIPALGPFFSNIAFLLVLYLFYKPLGIHSLGYAIIAGGFTYFIIQIPSLIKSGFRFRFGIDFQDENLREFFMLFIPFALAMGIPKLNNILSNIFSDEITGGNTALSQGFFIVQLPLSVFVAGISMISLPKMSKYFENSELEQFKSLIQIGLKMVFFFTLPSVVGLMILDTEIARFIYSDVLLIFSGGSRGKITNMVIQNIALAQYYFAPGIVAMGLSIIIIRAFQSMKAMNTLIYSGLASVILHLTLMTLLIHYDPDSPLRFKWIALSITLSSFFNLFLLILILLRKVDKFYWSNTLFSMTKMIGSAIMMGIVIIILQYSLKNFMLTEISHIDNILRTILLIIAGVISYSVALLILKEEEFQKVWNRLVVKLFPKRKG